MLQLLQYLPYYYGQYAFAADGKRIAITGIVLDACRAANYCDLKLELKPLSELQEHELLEIFAIEFAEAMEQPKLIQLGMARNIFDDFDKMGAKAETIAYLCARGYDVFGLKEKGFTV